MEDKIFLYSTTDICKNSMDTNNYKYVVLKNRLKLLLISDKTTDKSGCSLGVNVGSFDEPPEINGLAHFLEHLLFMGTEKYPNENDYMNYLSMHNGSSNAYTCNESTVYYFDISNKYFEEALDRFAQFFISPLFKKDSVDREISAVNSEFLGNVSNDSSRRHRLLQLCYKDTLEESLFNIGNSNTLKIDNIREKVIEFYEKTYYGDRMVGVVYSNKCMEDIEEMVQVFNEVPKSTNFRKLTDFSPTYPCKKYNEYAKSVMESNWFESYSQYNFETEIFKEECVNKLIQLKSIEDTRRLDIYIKTLHPLISNTLFDVLTEDILKEDRGCIKILKDLNLAYDMNVYIRHIKYYGILGVVVLLTDFGFENPTLVTDEIEKYFKNYKMSPCDILRIVDHNKINFTYKEKEDVIDLIEEMSDNLMRVPVKNILDYEYSQDTPSDELIDEVLKSLRKRSEWVTVLSSSECSPTTKDPVFEIEYDIPN